MIFSENQIILKTAFEKGWKYEIATYFGSGNVDLRSGIWMSAAVESVEKLETGKSHERGAFWQLSICEAVVFFFMTMGFPDFVLNTLAFRKCGWVDDKRLPGTLVVCSVLPGAIIAFVYLWGKDAIDMTTMLLCMAAIAFGSFTRGTCCE